MRVPDTYATAGLYMAAFVALVDQGSKWWVLNEVFPGGPGRPLEITSFFNIVLNWNHGITFGLLNMFRGPIMSYAFIAVAIIVVVILLNWLLRSHSMMLAMGLGAVMGGALGNMIDRVKHGAVVDFLDFHLAHYHWYAFNIADASIVTGVGLLLLEQFARRGKKR